MATENKKDLIIVNCYTSIPELADTFYPRPASKMLPKVDDIATKCPVREKHPIENSHNYINTIRNCYGFNAFNHAGFVFPLWSDLSIIGGELGSIKEYVGVSPNVRFEMTDPMQSGDLFKGWHVIKLNSPWFFTCNKDIDFIWTPNYYHTTRNDLIRNGMIQIVPGVINFKYQASSNIFVLVNKSIDEEIKLTCGDPLIKLIPLTEKEVEFRIHLVEDNEMSKYARISKQSILKNPIERQRAYVKKWEDPDFEV